jgi:hypothetical protein
MNVVDCNAGLMAKEWRVALIIYDNGNTYLLEENRTSFIGVLRVESSRTPPPARRFNTWRPE